MLAVSMTMVMTMAVSVIMITHVTMIVAVRMPPSSRCQRRSLPSRLGLCRRGRTLEGNVPRGTTVTTAVGADC